MKTKSLVTIATLLPSCVLIRDSDDDDDAHRGFMILLGFFFPFLHYSFNTRDIKKIKIIIRKKRLHISL